MSTKVKVKNNLDELDNCLVLMAPSGELVLGYEIYDNVNSVFGIEKDLVGYDIKVGILEKFGYLVYHPEACDLICYLNSIEIFKTLGY